MFENNLESMPLYTFDRAIRENSNLISNRIIEFVRQVFIDNVDGNSDNFSKALLLCSQFYFNKDLLMIVFEYLKRMEEKCYRDFNSFRLENTVINSIFNCMPGKPVSNAMRFTDILDLLTNPFKYGKVATLLASEYISHLSDANDEQWDIMNNFYLRCFQYQDKSFLYYLLLNLRSYFIIKPKGVNIVFKAFKKAYAERSWGLAESDVIQIMVAMGELEPPENDSFVSDLADRALNCEKTNDYNIGLQLATLHFEAIEYLWSAPDKVRAVIGDEVYKKALQLAFNDPELNNNEMALSDLLFFVSEFSDKQTLEILRKYCRYTSKHYFYNGKWDGVRTSALEGLCKRTTNQKLSVLVTEYYGNEEYTYKIFFLAGIYQVLISEDCDKSLMIEVEYEKARKSLLVELQNPNNLQEAIIQASEFRTPFGGSKYLPFFIEHVLPSVSQKQVLEICFDLLFSENEKKLWSYALEIIKYIGNEEWLSKLMCFNEGNPSYADSIANIVAKWRLNTD